MQFAHIAIHPYCKLPTFQICPIANYPCYDSPTCGRANCNSPLHVCFLDVHKYACKYTKKHHRHGMSTFACVVGANCNSPILQFTHIANYLHFKFVPIPNSPPFQNSPILQFALCCCMRFSLNSPPFQIHPHFKFAHSKSPLG